MSRKRKQKKFLQSPPPPPGGYKRGQWHYGALDPETFDAFKSTNKAGCFLCGRVWENERCDVTMVPCPYCGAR